MRKSIQIPNNIYSEFLACPFPSLKHDMHNTILQHILKKK